MSCTRPMSLPLKPGDLSGISSAGSAGCLLGRKLYWKLVGPRYPATAVENTGVPALLVDERETRYFCIVEHVRLISNSPCPHLRWLGSRNCFCHEACYSQSSPALVRRGSQRRGCYLNIIFARRKGAEERHEGSQVCVTFPTRISSPDL